MISYKRRPTYNFDQFYDIKFDEKVARKVQKTVNKTEKSPITVIIFNINVNFCVKNSGITHE